MKCIARSDGTGTASAPCTAASIPNQLLPSEGLRDLEDSCHFWNRWVDTYLERTAIRINLVGGLVPLCLLLSTYLIFRNTPSLPPCLARYFRRITDPLSSDAPPRRTAGQPTQPEDRPAITARQRLHVHARHRHRRIPPRDICLRTIDFFFLPLCPLPNYSPSLLLTYPLRRPSPPSTLPPFLLSSQAPFVLSAPYRARFFSSRLPLHVLPPTYPSYKALPPPPLHFSSSSFPPSPSLFPPSPSLPPTHNRILTPHYIQSILSTVFFNYDANGLDVSPLWWILPAVAIPLTALVLAVWFWWSRGRLGRNSAKLHVHGASLRIGSLRIPARRDTSKLERGP